MKIYTKTGDEGSTSLVGGKRISKSHLRLEAYGTVDELNSAIGCARASSELTGKKAEFIDTLLENFQNELFNAGSRLACVDDRMLEKLPKIPMESIERMEKSIDQMTDELPPLKNFILPGGSEKAAHLHLARTVCRRAERLVVKLIDEGESVDPLSIKYLNRLSDCLFVLARYANHIAGVKDVVWKKQQ